MNKGLMLVCSAILALGGVFTCLLSWNLPSVMGGILMTGGITAFVVVMENE